jgi:hypothetical protein
MEYQNWQPQKSPAHLISNHPPVSFARVGKIFFERSSDMAKDWKEWEQLYERCTPDERLWLAIEMLKRIEARRSGKPDKGREAVKHLRRYFRNSRVLVLQYGASNEGFLEWVSDTLTALNVENVRRVKRTMVGGLGSARSKSMRAMEG